MLDLLGAFEDMPEWDEIADQLFNAGQTLNPSELHGVLVGLMGAGFNPDDKHHLEQTLASAEKAVGVQLQGELVDIVSRLNLATLSAIVDTDYAFRILLPDDDDPIEQRLRSFSNWVTGFISGFTSVFTLKQKLEHNMKTTRLNLKIHCPASPGRHLAVKERLMEKRFEYRGVRSGDLYENYNPKELEKYD